MGVNLKSLVRTKQLTLEDLRGKKNWRFQGSGQESKILY